MPPRTTSSPLRNQMIIHAMKARQQYYSLLPDA